MSKSSASIPNRQQTVFAGTRRFRVLSEGLDYESTAVLGLFEESVTAFQCHFIKQPEDADGEVPAILIRSEGKLETGSFPLVVGPNAPAGSYFVLWGKGVYPNSVKGEYGEGMIEISEVHLGEYERTVKGSATFTYPGPDGRSITVQIPHFAISAT
ncbi:hypothetical protein [Pseudomonas sp. NPDC089406]|uniref:hypothetical protein n=1 Tax=Pseudomonas sp. NPDC089406 TaxID=3364463 RepID=UPI003850B18A